ncbi:MAG: hypothetical protein GF414_08540 [Candidatus Altiarchaeales archaeon]|nr:hypothetical protein [Candidatus Altiarchaeales archaeon]
MGDKVQCSECGKVISNEIWFVSDYLGVDKFCSRKCIEAFFAQSIFIDE